jgi:hypothetical protein
MKEPRNQEPNPNPNPTPSNNGTTQGLLIASVVMNALVLIAILFLTVYILRDSQSIVKSIKQMPGIIEQFRRGFGEGAAKLTSAARKNILPLVNNYIQNATRGRR